MFVANCYRSQGSLEWNFHVLFSMRKKKACANTHMYTVSSTSFLFRLFYAFLQSSIHIQISYIIIMKLYPCLYGNIKMMMIFSSFFSLQFCTVCVENRALYKYSVMLMDVTPTNFLSLSLFKHSVSCWGECKIDFTAVEYCMASSLCYETISFFFLSFLLKNLNLKHIVFTCFIYISVVRMKMTLKHLFGNLIVHQRCAVCVCVCSLFDDCFTFVSPFLLCIVLK